MTKTVDCVSMTVLRQYEYRHALISAAVTGKIELTGKEVA
jgi:hypothetical protein